MSSTRILTLAALLCGAVLAVPAHAQTTPAPAPADTAQKAPVRAPQASAPRPRRDRNVLVAEEIHAGTQRSMYEVIRQLRPRWLSDRGPQGLEVDALDVQVYMNDVRVGDVTELHDIDPKSVTEARYVSSRDAVIRFNPAYKRGVILLSTRTEV